MRLHVYLHNVLVGMLTLHHGNKTTFRFDPSYLTRVARPVLGRFFEDHLATEWEYSSAGSRLPPFFQNYLPEDGSPLRKLLARQAGVKPHRELELLAVLGADLPGAIVVQQQDLTSGDEARDEPAPPTPPEARAPLRFSLAGMQLKFSVLREADRFTLPLSGLGGHWIAKLPDSRFPRVPENEYAMLTWAKESGLDVPPFELTPVGHVGGLPAELQFHEPSALVVRRFDRTEAGRIHQEDFAQVLNVAPGDKYEHHNYASIGRIIRVICGDADFEEYLRRLVFVLLSGNSDAHLKNWSLIYPDGRRARLAPAYDLVCTLAYPGTDRKFALRLSRTKEYFDVTPGHFERLAARIGADPTHTRTVAESTATTVRERWRALRHDMGLPRETVDLLDKHLGRMRL